MLKSIKSRLLLAADRYKPGRLISLLGPFGFMKLIETKLLGRNSSTYCYNKPDSAFIQITTACQLNCRYCYRYHDDLINPSLGNMTYENFTKIARRLKGVRRMKLCWGGEPLMHKDLTKFLRFIKENHIAKSFGIVTNGMLMTPEKSDEILATGISFICFSLDSPVGSINDNQRLGGDFDTIINNLKYLAAHAGSDTIIEVDTTLTTETAESMKDMPELLNSIGVKHLRTQRMIVRTIDTKDISLYRDDDLVPLLRGKCLPYGIGYSHYPVEPKNVCLHPFREVGVTWDGKITPCCNIFTLGLNETPFDFNGVWNSKTFRSWRSNMLNRNYPEVCRMCCDIKGEERKLTLE